MSLRSHVLRGGAYLALREMLGVAVRLGGVLALTRLLGPADFGVYAGAAAIVTLLAYVAQWGTEIFLIRREHEPSARLYDETFTFLLMSTGCVTTVALGVTVAVGCIGRWLPVSRAAWSNDRGGPVERALGASTGTPRASLSLPGAGAARARRRRGALLDGGWARAPRRGCVGTSGRLPGLAGIPARRELPGGTLPAPAAIVARNRDRDCRLRPQLLVGELDRAWQGSGEPACRGAAARRGRCGLRGRGAATRRDPVVRHTRHVAGLDRCARTRPSRTCRACGAHSRKEWSYRC